MAGKELLIGISLIGIYVKAHNDQPSVCFKYVFLRILCRAGTSFYFLRKVCSAVSAKCMCKYDEFVGVRLR